MKNRIKVIIDTDPGHDDAMALMLAFLSPEIEVVAVTTVSGNSTIENTTRNARFILDFLSRSDIPVYSGASKPLKRDLIQAVSHGKSGLEGVDPTNQSNLTGDAPERIIEIVKSSPGEITLVTLGPMTNIAKAIQKDARTMGKVLRIVSMGGAIDVPGNQNRVAEFNIFVDPEAAEIVLELDVPKVLVPLDACNNILLNVEDLKSLGNPKLRKLLSTMLRPYINNLSRNAGIKAAVMYDPATIFYLLNPASCTTLEKNILVETKGTVTRGMTVVDKRKITDGAKPNALIAMYIKPQDFIDTFIGALNRLRDGREVIEAELIAVNVDASQIV